MHVQMHKSSVNTLIIIVLYELKGNLPSVSIIVTVALQLLWPSGIEGGSARIINDSSRSNMRSSVALIKNETEVVPALIRI